jgi:hypothetical protein
VAAAERKVEANNLISAQLSVLRMSPFRPAEPSVSCQVIEAPHLVQNECQVLG